MIINYVAEEERSVRICLVYLVWGYHREGGSSIMHLKGVRGFSWAKLVKAGLFYLSLFIWSSGIIVGWRGVCFVEVDDCWFGWSSILSTIYATFFSLVIVGRGARRGSINWAELMGCHVSGLTHYLYANRFLINLYSHLISPNTNDSTKINTTPPKWTNEKKILNFSTLNTNKIQHPNE